MSKLAMVSKLIAKALVMDFLVLPVFGKREAQTLHTIKYTTYLALQFSDLLAILKVLLVTL